MRRRLFVAGLVALSLASVIGFGLFPSSKVHDGHGIVGLVSVADAQTRVRNLLNRLKGQTLPKGIVKTNGRIEATQVDVSAKYPGRLGDISVEEGSNVTEGQTLGRVLSPEYEAQLRGARSDAEKAGQSLTEAQSSVVQKNSVAELAKMNFERGKDLIRKQAISQVDFDQRKRNFESADAGLQGARAQVQQAESAIKSAQSEVERIEAILKELILVSPRTGRIQYQLARSGEVVGAGAKVFTILDLKDVYMTIFLPAASVARLELGGEARIILDPVPQYVIPATVSFVAADAQFTPKTVETADEREKLMFRVKLKLDPKLLEKFYNRVKTGVRGLGVVRSEPGVKWPDDLQVKAPQ